MKIIIQDRDNDRIYTKYSLPNFEYVEAHKKGDTIILKVVPIKSTEELQEDFNKAAMR